MLEDQEAQDVLEEDPISRNVQLAQTLVGGIATPDVDMGVPRFCRGPLPRVELRFESCFSCHGVGVRLCEQLSLPGSTGVVTVGDDQRGTEIDPSNGGPKGDTRRFRACRVGPVRRQGWRQQPDRGRRDDRKGPPQHLEEPPLGVGIAASGTALNRPGGGHR